MKRMPTGRRVLQSRLLWAVPCLTAMVAPNAFANGVYKWIDEAGNTHYGDKPPAQIKRHEMVLRKTPAVDPGLDTRRQRTERLLNSFAAEREDKKAERAALAAAKKERDDNCEKARAAQQNYENSAFIYTRDPSGKRNILDDEARAKVMADARADVEKWCE